MSKRSARDAFCLLGALTLSSAAWSMGPDPGGHSGDGVNPSTTKTGQGNADQPTGNKTDESTGPTSGSPTQRGSTEINSPSQPKSPEPAKKN